MGLAFLPIKIDVKLPDEQKLLDFCEQHKIAASEDNSHSWWWDVTPVLMRGPEDIVYNNPKGLQDLIANRYNANQGTPQYLNKIDELFPEIPYMLGQLPFKEMTAVAIMQQKGPVDYHIDSNPFDNDLDPSEVSIDLEPKRYNILLNKHEYEDCFFVSHEKGGPKIYPKITREMPCHVICDRSYAHGADYRGPNKLMLCVIGAILDRPRHLALIQENYKNYRDNAVVFGDIL